MHYEKIGKGKTTTCNQQDLNENNTFLLKYDADARLFNKIIKHSAGITSNKRSIVNLKTYEWTEQSAGPPATWRYHDSITNAGNQFNWKEYIPESELLLT